MEFPILAFTTYLSTIDWVIMAVLLGSIVYLAFHSRKYNKSVADFLAANRCTRRYLLGIANGMAGLGAISIISMFQGNFHGGFANIWWGWMGVPFWTLIFITGFVGYRMRETRVLTLSQFFEVRYSRPFRIYAGIICFISGVVNFGIFPAVGARFFQHFCGLPEWLDIIGTGYSVETYPLLMAILLGISLFFVFMGGQIAVILTDFVQGAFTNVVFLVILVFLLFYVADWEIFSEVVKAGADEGKSKVNPFQNFEQEGFNFQYFLMGLIIAMYGLGSWQGTQGYTASSASAHESRMAGILGDWRGLTQTLVVLLLPMSVFMVLTCGDFLNTNQYSDKIAQMEQKQAKETDSKKLESIQKNLKNMRAKKAKVQSAVDKLSAKYPDRVGKFKTAQAQVDKVLNKIRKDDNNGGKQVADQMRVPVTLVKIFPPGLVGLFAAMMLAAFISTHDTYLHSWGSVFVQDVIMPFRKRPFQKKTHMLLLKCSITMVAVIIFTFSYFFRQTDHIMMFFNASAALFVGGAGICILGGLYSRKGTNAGAWCGLTLGSIIAVAGILIQSSWHYSVGDGAEKTYHGIYLWLCEPENLWLHNTIKSFFSLASNIPGINWAQSYIKDPTKFPVQGHWISIASITISFSSYIIASFIHRMVSPQPDFNLEKMLHRGIYAIKGEHENKQNKPATGFKTMLPSPEYSTGDKAIYWMKIAWTVLLSGTFIIGTAWNLIVHPWSDDTWTTFWKYESLFMGICGAITTIWFLIGGIADMKYMLKKLKSIVRNDLDSGFVIGHHNLEDENKAAEDNQGQTRKTID